MSLGFADLSPDQVAAVESAETWYNSRISRKTPFYLRGAAGTGKTTVARFIVERLGTTTQALAPTNRAARILRDKGVHGAKTIHSVLFQPVQWCWTENHQVSSALDSTCAQSGSKHSHGPRFFKREDPPPRVKCFTIDEASMVGARIASDVAMFDIPTVVIGDPYQLPPVGDAPGYVPDPDLPGLELDASHRFDSMSDIGQLANVIRWSSPGASEWRAALPYVDFDTIDDYDLVLAWRNETRWQIITMLRSLRGRDLQVPQPGDRLISIANTYERGVLNADELTVTGDPYPNTHLGAWNIPTAEKGVVPAWKIGFRDYEGEKEAASWGRRKGADICALTWSECMTVHKAQGGEWENVLVIDDLSTMEKVLRNEPRSINTWAYTATTRASQRVSWIRMNSFPTGMTLRRMIREREEAVSA